MVLGPLVHVTPSNFFRRILRSEALVYKSYFFQNGRSTRKLFDIRFSYNHCNFSRVCLLVKMASKTVTRSILDKPESLVFSGDAKIDLCISSEQLGSFMAMKAI